ncbi:hypothetical protein [Candidatus Marithrix sp. Canyon 246]|uniref:hypothetical protein n=2 Tax=Candidatus Marithrix sp. Canyon 246 TaxID=1827136 RepID=UPI00084A0F59|nr:hypothetical protein [Candidatus Marithrix sp. Canyon 246]
MFKVLNILILYIIITNICYGKADVTYYAFTMYKPKGENWQFLSDTTNKLEVGSYRFQLVSTQSDEQWFALRGEFEFITDVKGGVKLKSVHNLDEINQIDHQNPQNFSLWLPNDSKNNWNKSGRKRVQILINQMNKSLKGDPEPNFLRFLIRKKQFEESWQTDGINYRIYRLHYLKKDAFNQTEKIQIVSRFINPSVAINNNIELFNQWISQNDDFSLARYLGKADALHKLFFQDFKFWLNYIFEIPTTETELIEEDESSILNWLWILLGIVIVVIIAIITWKYLPKIIKDNFETAKINSYSQMSKNEIRSLIKTELKQIRADITTDIEGKGSEIIRDIVSEYFNKHVPNIIYQNAGVLLETKEAKAIIRNEVQRYIQQEFKDWEQRLNTYADEYWEKFIKEKTTEIEAEVTENKD